MWAVLDPSQASMFLPPRSWSPVSLRRSTKSRQGHGTPSCLDERPHPAVDGGAGLLLLEGEGRHH